MKPSEVSFYQITAKYYLYLLLHELYPNKIRVQLHRSKLGLAILHACIVSGVDSDHHKLFNATLHLQFEPRQRPIKII